jgi:hypothetical protein
MNLKECDCCNIKRPRCFGHDYDPDSCNCEGCHHHQDCYWQLIADSHFKSKGDENVQD